MPKNLPRKCKDDEYYQKAAGIVQEYIEKFGAGFHEIDELDCMIASALRESAEQSVQWTLATVWQKLVALFRRQSH